MDNIFKQHSQKILIYPATTVEQDPYEKNVEVTCLNPLPIRAIVTDLITSQIAYKLPSITTDKAKEIIIEKKYRPLLEMSYKIKIDDDYYQGWKTNGKLQIRQEQDYLRCYVYIKKD
jgi:hypothetical protein